MTRILSMFKLSGRRGGLPAHFLTPATGTPIPASYRDVFDLIRRTPSAQTEGATP